MIACDSSILDDGRTDPSSEHQRCQHIAFVDLDSVMDADGGLNFLLELERAHMRLVECERLLTRVQRFVELTLLEESAGELERSLELRRAAACQCLTIGTPRIGRRRQLCDANEIIRPPAR